MQCTLFSAMPTLLEAAMTRPALAPAILNVCVCVCVLCEAAIFRNYVCQQVIATCRDVCMQEIMAHDKVANQAHMFNREQAQDLTAPGMELQRRLLIQRNQGAWLVECKLV